MIWPLAPPNFISHGSLSCSRNTGLLSVPRTHRAHSRPRAFALAIPLVMLTLSPSSLPGRLLLTPIASRLPSNSTSTDRPPDSPRPIHHAAILTPKRFSELCLLGRKYVCIVKIYAPLNTYLVGRYALECKLQRGRGFLLPRCPPMCLPRQVRCLVHRLINTY